MKDLTSGNIYKNFFVFALPMVLAGVLSQMYHTIDTIIAGNLIGDSALAAIGATSPFVSFINSFFWGYSCGIGIYVANLFGAKKYFRVKNVVINNLLFISFIIILISISTVSFKDLLFSFLQVDTKILKETDIYFTICTLGNIFILLQNTFVHIMNGLGDGSYPLKMSVLCAVLNIAGNIFTVAKLDMGIAGLAVSTVISSAVVILFYCIKLKKCFKTMHCNKHKSMVNRRVIKETLHYSLPTMVQQSVMYFSSMILSPIVNGIGSDATSSYTVILRVYDVNASIYQNSAKTIGSHTAQCYGAKKFERIKKGFYVGVLQNIIFLLPVLFICIFFPNQMCGLFFDDVASKVAVDYSVAFLKYFMPFIILNVLANAYHNFFRAIDRMKALLIATIAGSAARIIFSVIFVRFFGYYGIFIGWVMFWVFDAAFGLLFYRFGSWRKEIK